MTAAATSTEDPIYRVIEEHRKAGQERYEIGRKPGRTDHDLDDAITNDEFVEMCVNGDEEKWSATRWARMMELALRMVCRDPSVRRAS